MDDGRWTRWSIFVAPLLLSILVSAPARADLLVNRLNPEPVAVNQTLAPCCIAREQAAAQPEPHANGDENLLPLAVLATVLFSNPDNNPPGGSTGGTTGGTPGGGGNPGPSGNAPEPATLISALVGSGLAGLYAAFRRKRLVKPQEMQAA